MLTSVSDSGARGPGFETYRRRVVSLSKTLYSLKVLVNYPGSDGSVPTWLKIVDWDVKPQHNQPTKAHFKVSVGLRIDKGGGGGGGKLSRAVYPQILLHHLLQEYLVERDINIISINLRYSLQRFNWVMYWQGVGGKLSRAVYLAPRPEFQREWIISNFYYIVYFRNI